MQVNFAGDLRRRMPKRYVIDFHPRDISAAASYTEIFGRVRNLVLQSREVAAKEEQQRNEQGLRDNPAARVNRHHSNFLNRWWFLSYPPAELSKKLDQIRRYVV